MNFAVLKSLVKKIKLYTINEEGHKLDHFLKVYKHSCRAIDEHDEYINDNQKNCIMTAALLHDMDDEKIFNTKDNYNTKTILKSLNFMDDDINLICEMINLVSCKKNKSSSVSQRWKLIPRDCDRLESIGIIGLLRASIYNNTINRPLFDNIDKIPESKEELFSKISNERYMNYNGVNTSFLGHFYDKLVHTGLEENLKSENTYVIRVATQRNQAMYDIIVNDLKRFENNTDLKNFLLSKLKDEEICDF